MAPTPFTLGSSGINLMPASTLYEANLLGSVNPNGTDTTWWFAYGTSPTLSGATLTTSLDAGSGSIPVTVTASVQNLTPGQTYYFALITHQASTDFPATTLSFLTSPPGVVLTPQNVLPPSTTATITTPHFGWPFTIVNKGASVVDQDTSQEIYACVAAIVNTQVGEIPEIPTIGLPDLTFAQMPPDVNQLSQIVGQQEPRASTDVVANALDDTGGTWQITLTPTATVSQT